MRRVTGARTNDAGLSRSSTLRRAFLTQVGVMAWSLFFWCELTIGHLVTHTNRFHTSRHTDPHQPQIIFSCQNVHNVRRMRCVAGARTSDAGLSRSTTRCRALLSNMLAPPNEAPWCMAVLVSMQTNSRTSYNTWEASPYKRTH